MTATASELFDNDVRIERMFWLPATVFDVEATPDEFEREFCENLPTDEDAPLYAQLPVLAEFRTGPVETADVAERLFGTPGFLIEAATPVREYLTSGASISSWGSCWLEWLYAASETDLERVLVEWAAQTHERDKQRSAAA